MRLNCLARAGARCVLRCARTRVCAQRRVAPLVRLVPWLRARSAGSAREARRPDSRAKRGLGEAILLSAGSGVARHCAQTRVHAEGVARFAPGAREAAQPHSRNQKELKDFGKPDHDLPIKRRPTTADRAGACFPRAKRGRPSGDQPSVRKTRVSKPRAERRASLSDASGHPDASDQDTASHTAMAMPSARRTSEYCSLTK